MFFIITCHDKPGHQALRSQSRPEHLKYLQGHKVRHLLAGPLLAADGETPCGSHIIIEAENRAAAEAFAKGDPYAQAGLFESVAILPWRPAVGDWLPAAPK